MQVKSTVKMNMPRIRQLTQAAATALELTADAVQGEVKNAQVMPFDTGHLQQDSFFADYSDSFKGKVQLVTALLMRGVFTITQNMIFRRTKIPTQRATGMKIGSQEEVKLILHQRYLRIFIRK